MSERRKVAWILGVLLVVAAVAGLIAANAGGSDGSGAARSSSEETTTSMSIDLPCIEKVQAWMNFVNDNGGPTRTGLQALLTQVGSEGPFFQWFSQGFLRYESEIDRVGVHSAAHAWNQQVNEYCDSGLNIPDPPND